MHKLWCEGGNDLTFSLRQNDKLTVSSCLSSPLQRLSVSNSTIIITNNSCTWNYFEMCPLERKPSWPLMRFFWYRKTQWLHHPKERMLRLLNQVTFLWLTSPFLVASASVRLSYNTMVSVYLSRRMSLLTCDEWRGRSQSLRSKEEDKRKREREERKQRKKEQEKNMREKDTGLLTRNDYCIAMVITSEMIASTRALFPHIPLSSCTRRTMSCFVGGCGGRESLKKDCWGEVRGDKAVRDISEKSATCRSIPGPSCSSGTKRKRRSRSNNFSHLGNTNHKRIPWLATTGMKQE